MAGFLWWCCALSLASEPIVANRSWEVLGDSQTPRERLREAGRLLGERSITFAGRDLGQVDLTALGGTPEAEPLVRALREYLRQPVDLDDFLLFLDDVLASMQAGADIQQYWFPAGRLRSSGVLLHPHDLFGTRGPRAWGRGPLATDQPEARETLEPAPDGSPLGPRWTARYAAPVTEAGHWEDLAEANTSLADRMQLLVAQLRAQGCDVYLTSTVRFPERGYLMWGAFELARAKSPQQGLQWVEELTELNSEWGLNVPIAWQHPDGWPATREAAKAMADSYDVVYATRKGARNSNHYGGHALDMVVLGLPRQLTLHSPSGTTQTWDLSDPSQSRDLSLTPEVIEWVEEHYEVRKLRSDYPHWSDARRH